MIYFVLFSHYNCLSDLAHIGSRTIRVNLLKEQFTTTPSYTIINYLQESGTHFILAKTVIFLAYQDNNKLHLFRIFSVLYTWIYCIREFFSLKIIVDIHNSFIKICQKTFVNVTCFSIRKTFHKVKIISCILCIYIFYI